jgi:hypothetical protein
MATALSAVVNKDVTVWFSVETFRKVSTFAIFFAVTRMYPEIPGMRQ